MLASLSVDLDNLWCYQKVHGDPEWDRYASYLDLVVPKVLDLCAAKGITITMFVVGVDAQRADNGAALRAIAASGHEIGNHSHRHEPWLHRYDAAELALELETAEDAIFVATGERPVGFRGPGYSLSTTTLRLLAERGYRYDATVLPTWIGPFARRYYFRSAKFDAKQRRERKALFGTLRDGLSPLRPLRWQTGSGPLVEIPVTTMPLLRIPIHASYLLYLAGVSPTLATTYFRAGLALCRARGVEPSLLFHPLDFLGSDDVQGLSFFPAMGQTGRRKIDLVSRWIDQVLEQFDVVTLATHAASLEASGCLVDKKPIPTKVGVRPGSMDRVQILAGSKVAR